MRNIFFDTETRSLVDLRAAGGAVYAEHPSTSVLCAVWVERDQAYVWLRVVENTDKDEVARLANLENTFPWDRFQPPKQLNYRIAKVHVHVGRELPDFYPSLLDDARWWAANGESFDKQVWKPVGQEPSHGVRNFTALSGSLQLPASVDGLGQLLFGIGKDPNGEKLIKSYCKEAAHVKSKPFHRLQTVSAYELAAYCARDVYILAAAGDAVLGQWERFLADHENAVLDVDSEIQEKGFAVDKDFAGRFKNLSIKVQSENVEALAKKLTARFGKKGAVTPSDLLSTLKSPQKMKAYVKKLFGVGLSSLGRAYLNDLVDGSQKFISEPKDGDEDISVEDIDEFEEMSSEDLESAEANDAQLGDSFVDPLFLEILKTRMDIVRTTAAKLDAAVGRCTKDGRIHYSTRTGSTITLRWAGSGFQPQNLPKGDDRVDVDAWRNWILKGGEKPKLEPGVTFQEVLSTLVRTLIYAQNNDCLFALDLSGIEARVLLWLANDFGGLEEIVNGTDRYWEIAKKLFGLDPSTPSPKKLPDSDERKALFGVYRQLGKTCLAGGTKVLTDRGWVIIEKVKPGDRLWDGVEWVSHEGVIYQGFKEVITYEGLTATPDHEVYLEDGRKVSFGSASRKMDRIARSARDDGQELRVHTDTVSRDQTGERSSICSGEVSCFGCREAGVFEQPPKREDQEFFPKRGSPFLRPKSSSALRRSSAAMHPRVGHAVQELRGSRDQVQIRFSVGDGEVDFRESRTTRSEEAGDRQDQQRRPLRTGELTLGNAARKHPQQEEQQDTRCLPIRPCAVALLRSDDPPLHASRSVKGGDIGEGSVGGSREEEGLAQDPTKAHVFDIVNVGPRNRFTAEGLLVSNCILGLGFGMGAVKFAENCVKEKINLEALGTTADFVVNFWRDENTLIAGSRARDKHGNLKPLFNGHVVRDGGLHKTLEKAVVEALKDHNSCKDYPREAGRLKVYSEPGIVKGRDLFIELPSGRPLIYRNARMQPGRFDPEKDEFAFDTYQKDQVRTRFCHGSKFSQNATQATARDLLAQMLVEVQKLIKPMGGSVILSVHDEIVGEIPSDKSEEALQKCAEAMTTRPAWAPDLPLGSEGAVFKTYRKTSQPGFPSCVAVDGKITKSRTWDIF